MKFFPLLYLSHMFLSFLKKMKMLGEIPFILHLLNCRKGGKSRTQNKVKPT